jgi:AcrR family transcriptional regulator
MRDSNTEPSYENGVSTLSHRAQPSAAPRESKSVRTRRSADNTRERILDTAEALFAFHGYDGTSIRDVASAAGVQIALVSYHFGPKERLYETIVERRSSEMGARRMAMLSVARERAQGCAIDMRELVAGYVWPFVERSSRGGEGWKNYTQLIARMTNSLRWGPIISRYYDPVARAYLDEMARTLPEIPKSSLINAFHFLVGAMLVACAETGRVERLSGGRKRKADVETAFADLLPFLTSGFLGVAQKENAAKTQGLRRVQGKTTGG